MTVRVARTFELAAPPERVWEFIADPAKRANAISVVADWSVGDDGEATWHLELPIPMVRTTVEVRTRETDREPGKRVKFTGRSSVMNVTGEHVLEPVDGGTRLSNRFVVDGKLPGVERFFERKFPQEIDNLQRAIERDLGLEV